MIDAIFSLTDWFSYLGDVLGFAVDVLVYWTLSIALWIISTAWNCVAYLVVYLWSFIIDSTYTALIFLLSKTGFAPEINVVPFLFWFSVANSWLPVSEVFVLYNAWVGLLFFVWTYRAFKSAIPFT